MLASPIVNPLVILLSTYAAFRGQAPEWKYGNPVIIRLFRSGPGGLSRK